MGMSLSVLTKFGLPSVDSLTDKAYKTFFTNVTGYQDFHNKFIEFCSKVNTVMPGKHYILKADIDEIKKLHDEWKKKGEEKGQDKEKIETEQKKLVEEFLKKNVEEYKPSSKVMIATGLVAPGAAVVLKNSAEKVPQLKMLRLNLVPNAVFVPTVTLISLIGVRIFNLKTTPTKLANKA